jgi:pyruvyl transferase EpsO
MTGKRPNPCASVLGYLAETIDDLLGPLLPPGTQCALLDFPNHSNVGDSAIWLGETEWLRRHGLHVVYACDIATYSRKQLAARLGRGIILFHGGGNLGDLWVEHQWFREQVIQDFPDHQVLQFPQTIHFMDEWGISEARRIFNGHKRLTLLCRDRASLEFARREFAVPSTLCPDMAFALGTLETSRVAEFDMVYLCRTDAESHGAARPDTGAGVRQTDWLEEAPTPLRDRNQALTRQVEGERTDWGDVLDALHATYDPLARQRLLRGCDILSSGNVVITDRLHGHILCLLLAIPHVMLDNNYGKIRSFYETWTRNCPLTHWAASPPEAIALAEKIVAEFAEASVAELAAP